MEKTINEETEYGNIDWKKNTDDSLTAVVLFGAQPPTHKYLTIPKST